MIALQQVHSGIWDFSKLAYNSIMELKLYHYVHCPFCIRVRMALGFLQLPYKSIVLPYNDEKTPLKLTGTKMLPIMEFNEKAMNESLDIVAKLDSTNSLQVQELQLHEHFADFNQLLSKLGTNVHNLAMPYWIFTPEFDELSRAYFQKKKEAKRGPFKELVKQQNLFSKTILADLTALTSELRPFYRSANFTMYDILLASHVWGLYVVPEFQFPEVIHEYLQRVKDICRFNYHQDFWTS